jgi:hypothetical protein
LPGEVERFLRKHGPTTSTEIALGVRARRDDVDEVLSSGRFRRAMPPGGSSPRAVYFDVSRRVLRTDGSLRLRAQRMLDVLKDGMEHSRSELLAAGVGVTNNAASELRGAGYDVRYRRSGGESFYRLGRASVAGDGESPPLEAA